LDGWLCPAFRESNGCAADEDSQTDFYRDTQLHTRAAGHSYGDQTARLSDSGRAADRGSQSDACAADADPNRPAHDLESNGERA
jgi:hypothetical protein